MRSSRQTGSTTFASITHNPFVSLESTKIRFAPSPASPHVDMYTTEILTDPPNGVINTLPNCSLHLKQVQKKLGKSVQS
ncbi:hypothetical protein QJS04_geneDACA014526 [Acorus gramineus]|uniref:Uncharacterized protein n=1 Tax=Acorus gramineus TaxID=55184 RepID=A0AAV9AS68_ACOGR|nr:hypothetical protein QJS04_geneDACA014526 [Acorus gramineus]